MGPQDFNPSVKPRRMGAVDEMVVGLNGYRGYVWSAIDVDSKEIPAVYASRGRSILNALAFLKTCENKPLIILDRDTWYIGGHMLNKVSLGLWRGLG